jgi:hypothetical protein
VALNPEDLDFISNFSTLWAVFLGAILATIGGFAATQLEWLIERRRRERNAALFFGEVLSTLNIVLGYAASTKKIGDPFGPITMRFLRSSLAEIEIYNRNRESLYDLRSAELRARIHTLILRIGMPVDGVFDASNAISDVETQLKSPALSDDERKHLQERLANLNESRDGSFEFVMDNCEQLQSVVKALEPVAHFSFGHLERVVENG